MSAFVNNKLLRQWWADQGEQLTGFATWPYSAIRNPTTGPQLISLAVATHLVNIHALFSFLLQARIAILTASSPHYLMPRTDYRDRSLINHQLVSFLVK